MLDLRSGLPRNGKTLSVIALLVALFKRWEKHPEEVRPVFVHGISELKLPVALMPFVVEKDRMGNEVTVPQWDLMPDGSMVFIDEAQDCFPPRSTQTQAPAHVAFLNRHGHRGFDITVITQHPKLLDYAVRALVGKHLHYRRVFGWQKSIVYEWDGCSDNLNGMKNATTSYFKYPPEIFKYYKSATLHTKQKFKYPLWLALPVVGIIGCLIGFPFAYQTLTKSGAKSDVVAVSKPSIPFTAPGSGVAPGVGVSTPGTPLAPLAAPVASVGLEVPKRDYTGCVAKPKGRCLCLLADGTVEEDPPLCRESAQGFGYLVRVAMNSSAPQNRHEVRILPDVKKAP
jgi:zona occludens toxin